MGISHRISGGTATRRTFLSSLGASSIAAGQAPARVAALTTGPRHHFFGYYGISPWSKDGRSLVCLETRFQDHLPQPEEEALIAIVNVDTKDLKPVTTTYAWNFQQGAMIHWNPRNPDEVLFNERDGADIISTAYNVKTRRRRKLPRAINGVSRNGRYALCLEYGRLTRLRPVVGYIGARDPNPAVPHPDNDGVFLMDLDTGKAELLVSIREVYSRLVPEHPELKERHMWFNHTVFNTDDTRFFFLARCWNPEKRLESAMFTCGLDGRDLREVIPFGRGVSHFEWRSPTEIMATFRVEGIVRHVLFTDGKRDYEVIAPALLDADGHCAFAPDGRRFATDRNDAKKLEKSLLVVDAVAGNGTVVHRFAMGESRWMGGDLRCDLHPRWNARGNQICVDAIAEDGTRQLHAVNLAWV